jgi:hypothetical protein
MTDDRANLVLRVDAVADAAIGVIFVLDSWDGLYDKLDLPQALPALMAQLGGAVLLGFAYLLWQATGGGALRRAVATAAAGANGAATLILAAWLVFRDKADLQIGTQGIVELIVVAVALALFAVAEAAIARREVA